MRTTIRMKPELANRAKAYARKVNRTFTEVVEEALTDLLDRGKQNTTLADLVVIGGETALPADAIRQAIDEMYLEDDLRALGMKIDPPA